MIAEYLDLMVGVTDNFSDDLMDLVGTLEYIDTLESRISPLRIRVNVHDQGLDRLENKLTRVQALSATNTLTSGVPSGGGLPTGSDATPLEQMGLDELIPSENSPEYQMNLGDLTSSPNIPEMNLGDLTPSEETHQHQFDLDGVTGSQKTPQYQMGWDQLTGLREESDGPSTSSSGNRATSDGGFLRLSSSDIQSIVDGFGEETAHNLLLNDDLDFLDANNGDSSEIFGVTPRDLQRTLPVDNEQFAKAFDWDGAVESVMEVDGIQTRESALSALTSSDFLKTQDIDFTEFFDIDKLKKEEDSLLDSLKGMRVGMTQFYDLFAAVIPLLGTFVGAMPAAIAGLGALGAAAIGAAAGLAGIAGLGFMGAAMSNAGGEMPGMEDFSEVLEDLPDQFFEAFAPLAQQLEPVFQDGLEGLEQFFNELAQRGDALTQLTDDARAFGDFLLEFVPNGLQMLALFADAARPVFSLLGEELNDRDILAGLAASLQMTLPYMMQLLDTVLDMLPGLVEASTGMMMWANAILKVVSGVGWLLSSLFELLPFVDNGNKAVGMLIGAFLTLTSVLLLSSKIAQIYSSSLLANAAAHLKAAVSAQWLTTAHLANAKSAIVAKVSTLSLASAVTALKWAIVGLLAVTGIGLVVAGIGTVFEQTAGKIDKATSSLGEFQNQYNSMGGGGSIPGMQGASGSNVYVNYNDNSQTSINAPDKSTGEELSQYGQYQDWASNESDFSTMQ